MPGEQGLARVSTHSPSEILTVSALARSVRDLLERRYPLLWVAGELSNFTVAKSGHAYFVLKDEHAQVRCVMFRQRQENLEWTVRGGGSIEDLWAFNEEIVERAIRACPVPVVTGIGHEPDFTIADFVADRRAPTPTAAAELVSPERAGLLEDISRLTASLAQRLRQQLERRMLLVDHLARRLVHPEARLRAQSELLGQLRSRLGQAAGRISSERRWEVARLVQRAQARLPNTDKLLATTVQLVARLRAATRATLERAGSACARRIANLSHLDPAAVLDRGYSVVRDGSNRIVLRGASLSAGELLDITFAEGGAHARVERSR